MWRWSQKGFVKVQVRREFNIKDMSHGTLWWWCHFLSVLLCSWGCGSVICVCMCVWVCERECMFVCACVGEHTLSLYVHDVSSSLSSLSDCVCFCLSVIDVCVWASPADRPRLDLIGRYGNRTPQWWSAVSMTTAGSVLMCVCVWENLISVAFRVKWGCAGLVSY